MPWGRVRASSRWEARAPKRSRGRALGDVLGGHVAVVGPDQRTGRHRGVASSRLGVVGGLVEEGQLLVVERHGHDSDTSLARRVGDTGWRACPSVAGAQPDVRMWPQLTPGRRTPARSDMMGRMAKRITHVMTYDASLAEVAAMLADADFRREVCERQGRAPLRRRRGAGRRRHAGADRAGPGRRRHPVVRAEVRRRRDPHRADRGRGAAPTGPTSPSPSPASRAT